MSIPLFYPAHLRARNTNAQLSFEFSAIVNRIPKSQANVYSDFTCHSHQNNVDSAHLITHSLIDIGAQ
ncbi:hypothetical protein PL18_09605 [Vibrio renipiscarius]|uniref:Uncharacterized protein n=1 Tax=Vibrio renipiscarius TaxID=1461322 RepID=A0A0C2NHP7_9VIBR|nr:hypothetical protein OJ16_14145 [Vibrio renipiscarius]KII79076.1 hypothetical protein PL18_09605 [Vibrio renipiscarius]